ncbi:transglycosylase SLT domain-containing protein [Pelistega europaea]|uniref:Transglycosylase SLT domain-containing protein n=1 Tax=Pelistega europaea TaxID=106147 RepID=A0A7Y4L8R1_9BURK|nr:transglycosylase SLT domain-containing protein [Pelistega europaea]NOL49054.1 hypothetical protein [Pelistega europaea]
MTKRLALLVLTGLLSACASNTTPPSNMENMCDILSEKSGWKDALEKARSRWGAPPQIVLSIIYQESRFKHDAKPPKDHLLWVIPWGRVSSAYGYPQAKDEVWGEYKSQAGSTFASRDNFADAADFVAWYMDKARQINGTSKWDAYNQYLNYHEGWYGFQRGTYSSKSWLKNVALKVKARAEQYGAQYVGCR